MRVLTAAQMREVDRLTIERGIPGIILMESAGLGVVELLNRKFDLKQERVAIVCGKGNNGGDGFSVARQLYVRGLCGRLTVFELFDPADLKGDAALARRMLDACGCPVTRGLPNELHDDSVLVDAVLGTGLTGPARGEALSAIRTMNTRFPLATRVAVDIPSGLPSDGTKPDGDFFHSNYTVTFTALKPIQALTRLCGQVTVHPIGSGNEFENSNPNLFRTDRQDLQTLFKPRPCDSNKGLYGHVLVIGGSFGKSGAPAMAGLGSYRSGAGLVTVAVPETVVTAVASYRPELMTEPTHDPDRLLSLAKRMTVIAIGPGLGTDARGLVDRVYKEADIPVVADADALNALAGRLPSTDRIRVLTPHPGEMGRLVGKPTSEVQADRLGTARRLAADSGAVVVLKGDLTLIAFPDGETWVNPTGSPAMATGGTGDILTGMVAGMIAQHPKEWRLAITAAVYLHGRIGELAGSKWGEQAMLATDMLEFLPEAMNEVRRDV
jgi:NAD(P)H-hydrate epimerase